MNVQKQISLSLCISLLLTACGSSTVTDKTPTSVQETAISEQPIAETPSTIALSEFELPRAGTGGAELDVSTPLYTIGCDSIPYEMPAETISHLSTQLAFDNSFYILDTYYTQDSTSYYFQKLSGDGETDGRIQLTTDMWNIDNGAVLGMDIVDDGQCVFLVVQDKEHYYAIYTDFQGNLMESQELTELPGATGYTLIGCDSLGKLYVDAPGSHDIYILDSDGKLLHSYRYSSPGETANLDSFRTSNGARVIICNVSEEQIWLQTDIDTGNLKSTRTNQPENVQKWYGMAGNVLYYTTNKQLVSWNTVTGERKLLSELDEISSFTDILDIAVLNTEDIVRLLVTESDKKERYIINLSPVPPVTDHQVIVANLFQEDAFFSGRVASFIKENPSYSIQYQALYGDEKTRSLLELATGDGPDVLYLNRQDLESLQANGALGDLSQLISQDTLDILLPGAVQLGSYEGKLSAVPLSVTVRTLLTNRDFWSEDSWTIDNILSAAREQDQLEGLFVDIAGQDTYFYNLYFMIGINIGESPFIEDGKCRFDCQEFRDILMLIKHMSQKADNTSTPENRLAPILAGNYLGVEYLVTDMSTFCRAYEKMGNKTNLIGYPSDTGKIYYLSDNGMLAVNQNSINTAGVKELVNYLLSLETQQYLPYQISVRLDIPESQLVYNRSAQTYLWQSPNSTGFKIPAKEDGGSYLEDYVNFLKNATPLSISSNDIFNIVMEETDSYFQSDKDLDTVIDIIQSRVQLYLDERN